MYVASDAPIPNTSTGPMNPEIRARYNARKNRVFSAVMWAASRYDCQGTIPVDAFPGAPANFLYQVQRDAALLNKLGWGNLLNSSTAQQAVSSTGTNVAPTVTPLNPVNTNPTAKQNVPQQGPFDTPPWGDAGTEWPGVCTPGSSFLNWLQQNPWLGLGALAAVALGAGVIGTKQRRRR